VHNLKVNFMKNLILNSNQNLFGKIDFESVKIGLKKDEMEETIGGYGGSGAYCALLGAAAVLGGGHMFWTINGGMISYCWNS
jgi:hypothetical protein